MADYVMDIEEIRSYLPQAYPALMIDRVLELNAEYILAMKNISANEEILTGHFPQRMIYPGTMILEGVGQACALHGLYRMRTELGYSMEEINAGLTMLTGLDKVKVRGQTVPGDQVHIRAVAGNMRKLGEILHCPFDFDVTADGKKAIRGTLTAAFVPRPDAG